MNRTIFKAARNAASPRNLMFVGLAAASAVLTGCGKQHQATVKEPVIRPALTEVVGNGVNHNLSYNGVVRAVERADLSFRIGGNLTEVLVEKGDAVTKGQRLARLDDRDAELALASAQFELDNIEVEYQRAKVLFEQSNAISQSHLDELQTLYNLAKNRRDEALRQLDYTVLKAPFDGIIGLRKVDNYVQVDANEPVFTLHNLNKLEVVIHLPDSVMLADNTTHMAKAEISAIPNQLFDLSLRTFATEADPVSQAYAVSLGFDDLKGYSVLPGMTARVLPVSAEVDSTTQLSVPLVAVQPDNLGNQFVWLVNDDNSVEKRFVDVGRLSGERVVIDNHLNVGDRIVIAGVSSLEDGMEIRPTTDGSEGAR